MTEFSSYVKNEVQEIKEKAEIPVRFAIYDNTGKFLGYKLDSVWTLKNEVYKVHPFRDAGINDHLLTNLVDILTNHGNCSLDGERTIDSMNELYVVVEEIGDLGNFVTGLAGYHINKKDNKWVKLAA